MQITSAKNPTLQAIRRAARAGRPTDDGLVVAEGPHLVEEALRGTWHIEAILTTPHGRQRYEDLVEQVPGKVMEVSGRAFDSIKSTDTSQEILALLKPRVFTWESLIGDNALVVALDTLQDPGNVGTIIRSAEAFGATGIALIGNCAHIANGKVLRASAGSIFR